LEIKHYFCAEIELTLVTSPFFSPCVPVARFFHGVLGTLRPTQKVAMAMTVKTNGLEKNATHAGNYVKTCLQHLF
jgi:hypothetical protein